MSPRIPAQQSSGLEQAQVAAKNPSSIPKDEQLKTLAYLLFGKTAKNIQNFFNKLEPNLVKKAEPLVSPLVRTFTAQPDQTRTLLQPKEPYKPTMFEKMILHGTIGEGATNAIQQHNQQLRDFDAGKF